MAEILGKFEGYMALELFQMILFLLSLINLDENQPKFNESYVKLLEFVSKVLNFDPDNKNISLIVMNEINA